MQTYFEQSYLSNLFPTIKMSEYSLSKLLDSLGRRQTRVIEFEQLLLAESSRNVAFDGHVVPCYSYENDLAEKGNKYKKTRSKQENIMMAYDIHKNTPLLSRIYEGGKLDKVSIKDILIQFEFTDTLFIVDRGFYSKENLEAFSSNNNHYIIPLAPNLIVYKVLYRRNRTP